VAQDAECGIGPRRLPIVQIDGINWFVDVRLRQFREVKNPHNFVDFDSEAGERMIAGCLRLEGLPLGPWLNEPDARRGF